ncbi:kinase-like domain-containing protein [Rhizophagus irregularis DAOM 181602=DAOM 197198]|nr:kinase-like domain-containing protein [Rhizophagus irregularis DAOM 181602=DAOM 197198]
MPIIRKEFVHAAINRSIALIDYKVHDDIHKQYEFKKQTVLLALKNHNLYVDDSLTKDEKTKAIRLLTRDYDRDKVLSGFSEIYTANWINGCYNGWNSKKQQLIRSRAIKIILKSLENVESANQSWFEEAESHLTISSKRAAIVRSFAPEVINGKEYTFKSDIYSIAMLMWEISSQQPPFINHEHDYNLAMNIINGIRPRIVPGIPVEYKNLMEECWDADPSKRPDTTTLIIRIREMNFYYQSMTDESFQPETCNNLELNEANNITSNTDHRSFTSKIHQFENLPEPRNATEDEEDDEVYNNPNLHSEEQDELEIPNDI